MRGVAVVALIASACARVPVDPPAHAEPELVGVHHVVQPGQTLWRIARAYAMDPDELALVNGIRDGAKIAAGTTLFVPGALAVREVPSSGGPERPLATAGAARLAWPLTGVLYGRFGRRGAEFHDGIDLAAPEGSPIVAAGAGRVLFAGEQRGYGRIVLVEHDDGLVTLYAHNAANEVKAGERVNAGQVIARVGQSGQTTGPHLHFEVREGGGPRDPLAYLPRPR